MSSAHCVVVWEWQCGGGSGAGGSSEARWLPHAPGVARTLERAHAKQLTRVVLADAEPELRGHYVNLRTLTQSSDTPEGGVSECRVRRACYPLQSPAARGARWEWARVPPRHHHPRYEPLPMQVQCLLEEAWARNAEQVSFEGWAASLPHMSARGPAGALRLLRRAPQPPYPRARPAPAPAPPHPAHPAATPVEGRRARIPQQHTGSSVHSVQSAHSVHSAHSAQSARPAHSAHATSRGGARSASPRERKPGLARQILHNLNIFSNNNKPSISPESKRSEWERSTCERDADSRRSRAEEGQTDADSRSGRRHSVDTVSTYLSHESKDGSQAGAGSLLNCSAGSDDVFACGPPPPPPPPRDAPQQDTIVGVDAECSAVCSWVRAVSCPQWGSLCPACRAPLAPPPPPPGGPAPPPPGGPAPPGAPAAPAVALVDCQHMLHLHCLNDHLERLRSNGESLYIECGVCGRVYGRRAAAAVPQPAAGSQPPGSQPPGSEPAGSQPAGSMAWSARAASLPSHPATATLLVTYNFQSGRQGCGHPAPGAPYYAVGFPRHSVLPDTELGRQVLMALRRLWERGSLFTVRASQTTGREHVVCWRVPPPPASPRAYPPDPVLADRMLADVLGRLQAMLPPPPRYRGDDE